MIGKRLVIIGRICNHVTEAVEENEGLEKNLNRTLILQLLDKLPEEVRLMLILQLLQATCRGKNIMNPAQLKNRRRIPIRLAFYN
jgi:hypothetical protein